MDLAVLIVVLGSAFGYVVVQYRRSRRPPGPPDPGASLGVRAAEVPRAARHTMDRMGVIRTSRSFRSIPQPLLVLAIVVVVLVVLVNLPVL